LDINEAIKLLGIEGDDDELIIKKKYRMMQKKWHPDLYQKAIPSELAYAEVMSKKINQAMELINDYISRYGLSAFRHEFFSTTAITHNNINYRTQERSNIYWDKNVDYFDYYFSKANDNPDAYKSSFGGFFSEQFAWVLSKANAFKFSKINAYFCDLKLKNCYYSFEPQILYTDESIDFSETQQIRINTILNVAANVGDEQTLKSICDELDLDYDELKGQVEKMQEEQNTVNARAALEGVVTDGES
jgi:curved DNA-binding protein CbpA